MIFKSSSIYRQSLWSFSTRGGHPREVFVRMQLERDKELMLCQIKQ